jgi:glucokinase
MFTVGTGVGGGMVFNGRLYRGATSAGETGHTVIGLDLEKGAPVPEGKHPLPGTLEYLAAGRALDRLAEREAKQEEDSFLGRRLAEDGEVTGHDVVDGAKAGDADALRVLDILGQRLGIGIANAINLFDPEEIVIGGGVSTAGELLTRPAEEAARRLALTGVGTQTRIQLARHGVNAGVRGASLLAAHELQAMERTP